MSELDSPAHRPFNIAVLAGGRSAEREVSLKSGAAVAAAIRAAGHAVFEFDPAREDVASIDWKHVPLRPGDEQTAAIDCVFIALHGAFGEDGQVQKILESRDVPYTGADSEASAVAFSKWAAKQRFLSHGIATPAAVRISTTDPPGFAFSGIRDVVRGAGASYGGARDDLLHVREVAAVLCAFEHRSDDRPIPRSSRHGNRELLSIRFQRPDRRGRPRRGMDRGRHRRRGAAANPDRHQP